VTVTVAVTVAVTVIGVRGHAYASCSRLKVSG
jgi:hypothetical protein